MNKKGAFWNGTILHEISGKCNRKFRLNLSLGLTDARSVESVAVHAAQWGVAVELDRDLAAGTPDTHTVSKHSPNFNLHHFWQKAGQRSWKQIGTDVVMSISFSVNQQSH
jgi:hypothetical protein